MTLNLQRAGSKLAEKIAALPARYPYVGASQKNVYLFTPTEAKCDLIVQALCAFSAASLRTEVDDESAMVEGRRAAIRRQLSAKLLSIFDRLGCFSFRSALASIWRTRSRETEN
jgi:hypothetical protein